MAKPFSNIISHWHKLIENFQASPLEFYATVERGIQERKIPEASTERVDWKEGGLLSARREYLRVKRGKQVFDICAAPFGTGFFISWWLGEVTSLAGPILALVLVFVMFFLLASLMGQFGFFQGIFLTLVLVPVLLGLLLHLIRKGTIELEDALIDAPIFGPLYEKFFNPTTYYRIDTALMFQDAVHAAVQDAIDQMSSAKGIRSLTESERKPVMREFYQR